MATQKKASPETKAFVALAVFVVLVLGGMLNHHSTESTAAPVATVGPVQSVPDDFQMAAEVSSIQVEVCALDDRTLDIEQISNRLRSEGDTFDYIGSAVSMALHHCPNSYLYQP